MKKDETQHSGAKAAAQNARIHKAKDNSLKLILDNPDLFVEFLQDFIAIDLLKDVRPSNIEDVTERFLPLFDENRDSDTVKKINLRHEKSPLFIIALVEHESKVNFRSSFKMLQYITLILGDYEKEETRKNKGAIYKKGFRYPPILPIVFYDGEIRWTAETNFLEKTELNDVFRKYIPQFEYELVSLNEYSKQDLIKFEDTLSLVMLADKTRNANGLHILSDLPEDYVEKLKLNVPESLNELLANVITTLLRNVNVPDAEIADIADKVYERKFSEMFTWIEGYDVQETRRVAKDEGFRLGEEKKELEVARRMKEKAIPIADIAEISGLSIEQIEDL